MRIHDGRSSWTRNGLTPADRAVIEAAGPGDVVFGRFAGRWTATVTADGARRVGRGGSMRQAFDRALAERAA